MIKHILETIFLFLSVFLLSYFDKEISSSMKNGDTYTIILFFTSMIFFIVYGIFFIKRLIKYIKKLKEQNRKEKYKKYDHFGYEIPLTKEEEIKIQRTEKIKKLNKNNYFKNIFKNVKFFKFWL
jgi:hypothetical protein